MKLREVFNKSEEWKWSKKSQTGWAADFTSDGIYYYVTFDKISKRDRPDVWHVVFEVKSSKSNRARLKKTDYGKSSDYGSKGGFDIIGSGNALSVLSTTYEITKDFIKKKKPNVLEFTAEEPSRQKLYKRMVINLAKPLGYKIIKMSSDGVFQLEKIK